MQHFGVALPLWQNAVEAMPQGGALSWRTSLEPAPEGCSGELREDELPGFIRLRIRDTGVGMDDATRGQMFEPFFTTKPGKARGLGMTEVYKTVSNLRGFIAVDSQSERGTCIDIWKPSMVSKQSITRRRWLSLRPQHLSKVIKQVLG